MIDTTIKAYATRQASMALLAVVLAATVAVVGRTNARPGPAAEVGLQGGVPRGEILQGRAVVQDGDTIDVGQTRVRLEGIDAPEAAQSCGGADGRTWLCGRAATRGLERLIGEQTVRCVSLGPDKYGRTLGQCSAGGRDLNREMVRLGLAWAFVRYSQSYVGVEAEARAAKAGIWSGNAQPAWEYRQRSWASAEPVAPQGCAIKGNVTANGLIYHMPWSPWYHLIKMDGGRGKRWFCSEDEALAAGWRPARMQ